MKKIQKLSLVWKMTLLMTLLMLIPIIAVYIFYLQTFRVSLLSEAEGKLQNSLSHMQSNIDGSLKGADALMNELVYRQEFSYFLDANNQLSEKERAYYISNLQKELINSRYLYSNKFGNLGIYSTNEQIDEKQYPWQFYMKNLKEKPYYQEIIKTPKEQVYGQVRNVDFISSTLDTSNLNMDDTGSMSLPIYRKIVSLNTGELIGVIETDVDVARLVERNSLVEENKDIKNLLLDGKKNILFSTTSIDEVAEKEIVSYINGQNNTRDIVLNGKRYVMSSETCDKTGLILVALLSNEELLQYIQNRTIMIVLIIITTMLVMALITYYVINNMLKRLVVLDHMMGKVEAGDFGVAISDNKIEDEVTRITRSFNSMASHLDEVLEEKVQHEKTQKDAELRALQAQINPHFLYNTLENLRMQCEIDEYYSLSNSLSALGDLFRYSIQWGSNEVVFELEWENLTHYLSIMQMRFEEEVICELECDLGLEDIVVPKLMLQPLIENCFNHGFKNMIPPWKIWIYGRKVGDYLQISIEDNGVGIDEKRMERLQTCLKENKPFRSKEKQRNSIGVTNVKQRLDMICKEGSNFHIESEQGKGTKIEINIKL